MPTAEPKQEQNLQELLARTDRWLGSKELQQTYLEVYPRIPPNRSDTNLQIGKRMSPSDVEKDLGQDMVKPYSVLEERFGFHYAGARQHALNHAIRRHLWDTAFRAQKMGQPLEVRLAAIMHDLIEFKARETDAAFKLVNEISQHFEQRVGEYVVAMADLGAIIAREVFYEVERNGKTGSRDCPLTYIETLARIRLSKKGKLNGAGEEVKSEVGTALRGAFKATPEKRIVPVTAALGSGLLVNEVIARLHPGYVNRLYQRVRAQLEHGDPNYYVIPLVKALAHIDRLRTTMGDFSLIEQASRRSANFLQLMPDRLIDVLDRSSMVDNRLYFLSIAMKTELVGLLRQEAQNFGRRPDTTSQVAASILKGRLAAAEKAYGREVIQAS